MKLKILIIFLFIVPITLAKVEVIPEIVYPGDTLYIIVDPETREGFYRHIFLASNETEVTEFNTNKLYSMHCDNYIDADNCGSTQVYKYDISLKIASLLSGSYNAYVYDNGLKEVVKSNTFSISVPEQPKASGTSFKIIDDFYIEYDQDKESYTIVDENINNILTGSSKTKSQKYFIGVVLFNITDIPDNAEIKKAWLSLTQNPYKQESYYSKIIKKQIFTPVSYLKSLVEIVGSIDSEKEDGAKEIYGDLRSTDKIYYVSESIEEWPFNVPHVIELNQQAMTDIKDQLKEDWFLVGFRTNENPGIKDYIRFYDKESGFAGFGPILNVEYSFVLSNTTENISVLSESDIGITDSIITYEDEESPFLKDIPEKSDDSLQEAIKPEIQKKEFVPYSGESPKKDNFFKGKSVVFIYVLLVIVVLFILSYYIYYRYNLKKLKKEEFL